MSDSFFGVSEQEKAGKHRQTDATALLREKRWRGAMYMSGYAVECLLKAKLMRKFGCRHLRELEAELQRRKIVSVTTTVFTHQLEILLRWTDGLHRMRQNKDVWPRFNLVNRWTPAWRYHANHSNRHDAQDFLKAVERILMWLESNI